MTTHRRLLTPPARLPLYQSSRAASLRRAPEGAIKFGIPTAQSMPADNFVFKEPRTPLLWRLPPPGNELVKTRLPLNQLRAGLARECSWRSRHAKLCSASSRMPAIDSHEDGCHDTSAWLVQMFEVATTRGVYAARASPMSKQNHAIPAPSTVCPASRPGICRRNCSLAAMTPQNGPP